jgi:hypothetical protein
MNSTKKKLSRKDRKFRKLIFFYHLYQRETNFSYYKQTRIFYKKFNIVN